MKVFEQPDVALQQVVSIGAPESGLGGGLVLMVNQLMGHRFGQPASA